MNNQPIVGLDLSLASTGIAVHYGDHFGGQGTYRIRSTGKAGATWDQRAERLDILATKITQHIPPLSLVIVEGPSYASVGTGTHDRAGLWWMVYQLLRTKMCTIIPVSPAQRMKYATGKGGGKDAGKDNVLAAAIKTYPHLDITGNDIADAVIFLAIGCRLVGSPLEENLPKARLDAMAKIELPEGRLAA